jgi:hypothetical protein
MSGYTDRLDGAEDLAEIFEIVKDGVREVLGQSRGGLMLGLADLGNHPRGFFGGYHYVATNVIVLNRVPLMRIKDTQPDLYAPYAFTVLLHEYLHTLGYLDETLVRRISHELTSELFGADHITSQIVRDTRKFFPNLVYPMVGWAPKDSSIELVEGFDRSSWDYIA